MYNIEKELSDISWNVPESTYRADPALSYSILATYERSGFDGIPHLFDKKESPSLTLGSVVDSIITGGQEEFYERFIVMDLKLSDSGIKIVKALLEKYPDYNTFEEIPELIVSMVAKDCEFWKADKWDSKRYSELLKSGNVAEYFNACKNSDKTIIDVDTYNTACNMVAALQNSPATHHYFCADDEMSSVRRYYQLKFKAKLDGVVYRVMADEILVDYENKVIYPIDLKTSSHSEWNFPESFLQWSYMIQSRLYWKVIKANLMADPYFKDFRLMDYRFIVVNRFTLTPLVWEFPLTQASGTLVDDKGNEYRDPCVIGKELRGYLDLMPKVPNGISLVEPNKITCLHKQN